MMAPPPVEHVEEPSHFAEVVQPQTTIRPSAPQSSIVVNGISPRGLEFWLRAQMGR